MKLVLETVLCLLLCVVPLKSENNRLKEVFAWKFVDYAWGKPEDRDAAIASGEFVPENNLPLGLEVWKDKLFITVPRWKNGVVSTLNYVKITDTDTRDSDYETDISGPTDPPTSTIAPPPTNPITPAPSTDPTTPPPPTDPTTPPPPTDPTTPPPPTDPTTPPPPTDPTTPPPPTDPTTPPPPTDPTTPPPPTDPTTPPPSTTENPTTPTDDNEDANPLPTASILPMPARSFGETVERYKRSPGEVDELTENIFSDNSSKSKRKHKKSKKHEKDVEDKEEKKDKKEKKNKDEKDKSKKKKKKKCKPKPKPTTPALPLPTPETTTVTTETTGGTTGTETTAPPPPPSRSPPLIPYPSFAANRVSPEVNEKADDLAPIVSVFRVWADACDRLWVMDTGVADILGKTTVVSKPRILIYNLNNDELIKVYEFKDSDSEEHSFFANIIVDTDPENCDKAFAYVPDLGGYGIVSYDFAKNQTRRIKHNYFHFDPLAGNMEVGGVNFQWTDGVFSVALTKPNSDGYRTAYFHCLASTKEFSVSTKILQNEDDSTSSYYDYKLVGDRGDKSQSSASFIHENTGIMFYTQLQKDSVNCWNTNKPMKPENLVEVASDNETMIFTNDLKVDREGNLWVLTDKLPVFIYKGLDDSEVNYRIFTATVDEAVAGTNCAP